MKSEAPTLPTVFAVVSTTVLVLSGTGLWSAASPSSQGEASQAERRLGQAVAAWEFSGFNGTYEERGTNVTWYDFAFPLWRGLSEDDVDIEVAVTWPRLPIRDGDTRWTCAYYGLEWNGSFWDTTTPAPRLLSCLWYLQDRTIEVTATVEGDGVDVSAEDPLCRRLECNNDRETWIWSFDRFEAGHPFSDWLDRPDVEDPVLHFTVFAGGREPVETEATATWNDTVMAVTSGTYSDQFTYSMDDFQSTAFVRADAGFVRQPAVQSDGWMEVELTDPGQRVFFGFLPPGSFGWDVNQGPPPPLYLPYHGIYRRPDGSVVSTGVFETNDLAGTWRFWYDESVVMWGDAPVLHGTLFEYAKLPWEE